jgi:ATP-binding cassette subfamily F protein 3
MLLTLNIQEKSIVSKLLFQDLSLTINEGEKIAAIGRNGVGKTTLFNMVAGIDTDYIGTIEVKKSVRLIITAQEHFNVDHLNSIDYILQTAPRYHELHEIVETYPGHMGDDMQKITVYSDALAEYGERGYFDIREQILGTLATFEISQEKALLPLANLSGGQKRFVELARVRYAEADLVLLDEPTNHMDYWGKALFQKWIRDTKQAVFVITHDRDVLKEMDKILEMKDKKIRVFPGNYDAYLRQNSTTTLTQVSSYEESLKTLEKLRKQMVAAGARKAGASNSAPKILEERLRREYNALKDKLEKPSLWIDQESVDGMKDKVVTSYNKYKDRNINIAQADLNEYSHLLLDVKSVEVGYDAPLFKTVSFSLRHADRLFIKGRNGAGKSTLISAIVGTVLNHPTPVTLFAGEILSSEKLRLGMYEQELDKKYLNMTLGDAVVSVYFENKVIITAENLNKLLAGYLFDPMNDGKLPISSLSGGQKARFQLMKMFCNNPNVLILDEPTNHLDLPSIEELEKSLITFEGAILYVSHDSYFVEKMGGETLHIHA